MPRNFLVRAVAGVAISLVALWLVLRSVDLAGDRRRPADGRLALDRGPRRVPVRRPRRPDAPLAAPPRADRRGPVSPHAGLPARWLPREQRPAGPDRRAGPEPLRSATARASPRSTTLGTIVVERIVDLVTVVAIASVAILVLSVRGIVASAVLAGVAVAGLLAVGLAIGIAAHRLPGAERIATWASATRGSARPSAGCATGCASRAGRGRSSRRSCSARSPGGRRSCAFAAAGQSIDVQLTIGQAALLASGVALASAIPAGPASLGTFELAAVEIGKAIGVSSTEAFAIGLIAHVSILVVTSIGGVAALIWLNWPRAATAATPDAGLEDPRLRRPVGDRSPVAAGPGRRSRLPRGPPHRFRTCAGPSDTARTSADLRPRAAR